MQFVAEQNPFDVEDNLDNGNHNANLEEENDNDINLIDDQALLHVPPNFPVDHDNENQNEGVNQEDMESDDESLFDGMKTIKFL